MKSVLETSVVLNIVLHIVYDLPCDRYCPTFENIEDALKALKKYGVDIMKCINPSSNIFRTLMDTASSNPLTVYALASSYDIPALCTSVSAYLLSVPLTSIPDEVCINIGVIYLRKLLVLQSGRIDTLKGLILPPPLKHAPSAKCDYIAQGRLARAWALTCAYVTWKTRPDIDRETVNCAFSSLAKELSCSLCKKALEERVKSVLISWSLVKVSPSSIIAIG